MRNGTIKIFITGFSLIFIQMLSAQNKNPLDFIPKGHVLFEKIEGDLNKDEVDDMVLITKGTTKDMFFNDDYRGLLDRNRRGIIVLFKKGNFYEVASKNLSCFSSENEDGGVYYAPELGIEILKGNLYIHYAHGRYGYWRYTFRYQNSDFEMIGFDSSDNNGPVANQITSINFSTKKKLVKTNTNPTAESGEEVFESQWRRLKINKLLRLSKIIDFDDLELGAD